jgi:accessory colonization factor AcfC
MELVAEFIAEDDSRIAENGGIIDKTGLEGLDEDVFEDGTEDRWMQRAKSAANIYYKNSGKPFKALGCQPDEVETSETWIIYKVVCSNADKMEVVKTCVPRRESIVSIVVPQGEQCGPKITGLQGAVGSALPIFRSDFGGLKLPHN